MLSTLCDTYFSLSMHFKMLSAISFDLEQSKIFSSGNGLTDDPNPNYRVRLHVLSDHDLKKVLIETTGANM